MNKKYIIALTSIFILFIISFILALMVGRYSINLQDFFNAIFTSDEAFDMQRSIILNLRLSRTIIAALTGVALSLSGLLFQELFQNKLVSPDLLGVSNGAGVGAAIAIVLSLSTALVSLFAFIIAIGTVILTIIFSKIFHNKSSSLLLLSGIIIGGFMSSLLSMIKYFANPETQLSDITYWLMGSFADSTASEVLILGSIVLICLTVLLCIRWRINVVALGIEEAQSKGINYTFYRTVIIIIATILTATSVAFSGTISWVGLVIPHIVRLITGKNTSKSIPLTAAFGGVFMIIVDIISRSFTTSEIPLSAVTGLFETVIFVGLIFINRRKYHEY